VFWVRELLYLPPDFSLWGIFAGQPYSDNGRKPAGKVWLQDIDDFTLDEIEEACTWGGARVVEGYVVNGYGPDVRTPTVTGEWCLYRSKQEVYTVKSETADRLAWFRDIDRWAATIDDYDGWNSSDY